MLPASKGCVLPAALLSLYLATLATPPAQAEGARSDDPGEQRIEALERRVEELEADREDHRGDAVSWTDRVRLGGSANTGYYGGQEHSVVHEAGFLIWDARFFIDADLGRSIRLFDTTLVRNVGFTFEWNLVRLGRLENDVGELYVDFQAIGNTDWVNLQLGRFQIPIGENYLRFSQGYSANPFISNAVGGAWFWDEGVKLYGGGLGGWLSYVASIGQAETAFNDALSNHKQYTLKLMTDPVDWLHLSASGLYTGAIGSASDSGSGGALWLGEMWARRFGAVPVVPNYVGGVQVPNGPKRIARTWFVGGDAIIDFPDKLRLWLSYGYYDIDQESPIYDRALHTWIAELLLYGGLIHPHLEPIYLGLRANGLGTYDSNIGELLDFRTFSDLGFNTKSINDYSVVLGWKMLRYLTLRIEYTRRVISVVSGVDPAIRDASNHNDSWGFEVGIHF
jgi:hypothetical protein